jgi:hypothetical protein
MTATAERAGVALDTVYASVGRKPELARLLIETAISGSSQAVPAEDRDYVRAIQAAPDAETKIAIYASAMRLIAGRLAPVLGIVQQAAPAEPELAALWREIAERRAANMRRFVADLAAVAALRVDPCEAADIVWVTNAPSFTSCWPASEAGAPNATSASSPTPGAASSWPAKPARQCHA